MLKNLHRNKIVYFYHKNFVFEENFISENLYQKCFYLTNLLFTYRNKLFELESYYNSKVEKSSYD